MADSDALFELISNIKKTTELGTIEQIERIERIENDRDMGAESLDYFNRNDIKKIIHGYKMFPLYLIKYIFTTYPRTSSGVALDHIVTTNERRSDLMECILTAFAVKLSDISNISFDCRMVLVHRTVAETMDAKISGNLRNILNGSDHHESDHAGMRDLIDMIGDIDSHPDNKCIGDHRCNCMDRRHWYCMYDCFMGLIEQDYRFMFESYNVNNSIANLVAQTDVADDRLVNLFKGSIKNPDRWRGFLLFIKKTGLVSSAYGDMLFSIRDTIILNNRSEEADQDPQISGFRDLVLLSTLLKQYNQYHKNMSKITDNVYITDINGARNTDLIRDKGIECIVSLTKKTIFKASNVRYFHIRMDDVESVDFLALTLDIADKVIELIQEDRVILVHCYQGVSRSVSFVILVLVKQGMTYEDALKFVKSKRPSANPNPAFRQQLSDYSLRINRKRS